MRIASLQPSVALTLAALGRLDRLCACTRYCVEALPELFGLPILHDSWTSTTEEIVGVGADLVIASVPYRMESLAAILKAGVPVLALAPHTLADIYRDIRLIAAQTDARDCAEKVIATMQAALVLTASAVDREPRRRVYCEEWGKPLIHSQPWVAELVRAAGGSFIGKPGAHTTVEAVAAADPDILIFAWCGAGNRVPLARVVEQRGWQELRAVRSGQVFCVPDEWLNTPAPTLVEGLKCLAAAFHPKRVPAQPRLVPLHPASLTAKGTHSTL